MSKPTPEEKAWLVVALILTPFWLLVLSEAVADCWAWFVVPAFGAPAVRAWQWAGMALLAAIVRGVSPNKRTNQQLAEAALTGILANLLLWGIAAGLHWWVLS